MSPRRIWSTAKLDIIHNLHRPLFWIWLLILAATAYFMSTGSIRIQSGSSDVGGVKSLITSEFGIALMLGAFVLTFYAFFVAVAAGMTVLKDEELRVGEVLHSTPLGPREYVWGKFLAAMFSFLVVLAVHLGLVMFFNHVASGAEEAEFIGPFELENYYRPALYMAFPTILFLGGVTFWMGARFKRPILVFFLPVALLLICDFFLLSYSPEDLSEWVNQLLMAVDPTGFRWLSETYLDVDRGVSFYNSSRVPLETSFLISRVAFCLIGLFAVGMAARHFARNLRGVHDKKAEAQIAEPEALEDRRHAVPPPLRELGMQSRRPSFLSGLWAVVRVELGELLHSPGLYLFVPLIVMITAITATLREGPFGTDVLLTSGLLAVGTADILTTFVCALLMFYTIESLRREEGTGLASIHFATPVRTASILFGKAVANSLVGVATVAATIVTVLVILLVQGSVPIELTPLLLVWCGVLLPTFLIWCSFVSLAYSFMRNRYTTYAVSLAAIFYTGYKSRVGEVDWVYNWALFRTLQWSDLGVFELIRDELVLNRILVLAATLAFTVLTVAMFPRRQTDATNRLLRLKPIPLLKSGLKFLPVALPVLVLAIMIGQRVDAGYQGDAADKAGKDYWRKNIATWREADFPDLAGVEVQLDLYPDKHGFEAKGSFKLTNRSDHRFEVVPLTPGFGWRRPDSLSPLGEDASEDETDGPLWTVNGEPFKPEDSAGLMLFRLAKPLMPKESVEIGFHYSGEVPFGATKNGGGAPEFILPGGVVLTSFRPTFVPAVGYIEGIGVDEDNQSDAKEYPSDFFEGDTASLFGGGFAPYHVKLRVSAPQRFRINCVGVMKSDTVEAGRRISVWETDQPVRFFNVVCGEWAVERDAAKTVEVYYHKDHHYNVKVMAEALAGARKYYSEWFHPYPWQELKLSQFPGLAGYAQGFATNITFSEAIGFLTKDDADTAEAPFMVTAHEAAHQWWGNLLVPGEGPGGNILSEGMAHFSTLLLLKEMRGEQARIDFARRIEDQYGNRRQADSERPMIKIDGTRPGDTTVTYDKGGWVFWMLLNHMGRDACLKGIQSFIAHYSVNRDHPVLQDFVAHMRPFASDQEAYDAFTKQWFFEVVLPQYAFRDAVRTGADKSFQVTLTIENTGTGKMPLTVAATRGERFPDKDAEVAAADAYQEVRQVLTLSAGESKEITFDCPFEPERVLVDPDAKVLMLKRKLAVHKW